MEILNEVYFGEEPVKELQTVFSKFRKKWVNVSFNPKINYDPDLLKFNRLVEKIFGYYQFSLIIDPSMDLNAYMMNIDCLTYNQSAVKKDLMTSISINRTSDGFRYAEGNKVFAISCMYYGLLSSENITDRECVAVMLHEIGHSFTKAVLFHKSSVKQSFNIFKQVIKVANKNISSERDMSMEKAEADIKEIMIGYPAKIMKTISDNIGSYLKSLVNNTINILKGVKSISASFKKSMGLSEFANERENEKLSKEERQNKNFQLYAYTDEKFADTFAAMYGYGPDIHMALDKMGKTYMDFYLKDKKVPGTIATFLKVNLLIFNDLLCLNIKDPHPDGLTRVQVSLEYAKKEMQYSNVDPKVKQALAKEIEEYTKIIDEYLSHKNDKDAYRIIRNYHIALYEKYGGDVRESVTNNNAIFKMVQNAYNDLLKKQNQTKSK